MMTNILLEQLRSYRFLIKYGGTSERNEQGNQKAYRKSDLLVVPKKSMKIDGGKGQRIIAPSKA